MSTRNFSVEDASCGFRPVINRHSRRLASGLLPVEERQQHDIVRREQNRQKLLAKVEEERQRNETFMPVTNPRVMRSDAVVDSHENSRTALIRKVRSASKEETFRPIINAKSQLMVADGTWQSSHQQLQEVRQRVQTLWRTHAGIGSGEITLSGVYATLQELGLQVPSAIVDKFLLALGLDEAAGVRCVAYDRFVKVFTIVLRAALRSVAGEDNGIGACDADRATSAGGGENQGMEDEPPRPRAISSLGSMPTMRRVKLTESLAAGRRKIVMDASPLIASKTAVPVLQRSLRMTNSCIGAASHDGENSSPSPTAPSRGGCPRVSAVRGSQLSEESPGLSCSLQPRLLERTRQKKTAYDPLQGCTFAPTINKRVRVASSKLLAVREEQKKEEGGEKEGPLMQTKCSSTVAPYKSRDEQELEECTFVPNTARFHKDRDSLAWWKREPFVGVGTESTMASSFPSSLAAEDPSVKGSADEGGGGKLERCDRSSRSGCHPYHHHHSTSRRQRPEVLVGRPSPVPLAVGFDKAVQRMTEARKKSRPKFEELLRSSTEEPQKPIRPTVVEPFSLQAETRHLRREQQKPVLYVDVDLPSGKTGRIGVHRGDEAASLARRFSNAYGLNEELRQRLESLLTEKLKELLQEHGHTLWL
ncbi:hypothetical protein TraAM80_02651 [Trypanosoma rangeli]|uniref:Uncharacterized protein n=1 Tax=Trypanosoma rangeli TaxID=5698 RepID=A0A422NT15_TRYRA|nr:uncharacterized protein TraAM80_02651 [Trypanosoma rangeli]RNF08625.1 hypothetical protein TraAM80_02651 [Trypanosoma rangeli]|eukprot:RNF08625.1 hypothetical protein TraAM80_02651 [Trypanosoma rangeli]